MVTAQESVTTSSKTVPHILVVDDEIGNRRLLQRILAQQYVVTEAENGRQALDLLQREPFDLALLDFMMPDITGLEVLKTLRRSPQTAELPVILISAMSQNDDMIRGLNAGANDYIVKPFDIDVVMARIDTQLKLKHLIDAQHQTIIELEAAQQMKDRLLRIASHDLKSPLANIKLAETLLRKMIADRSAALELLDDIQLTAHTMKEVVEEFLEMAACQSGGIDLHIVDVDVKQVVMDTITHYAITAHEKDINLEIGDLPGIIRADRARLAQILSNLVSNAIKYSPKHTTITVWSALEADKGRIHVADEGPGIPVDERGKLFKEFGKLSTRPTNGESSTGLGLWIVKHMAKLQKGDVGVSCPPEGGSVFWVEFPCA